MMGIQLLRAQTSSETEGQAMADLYNQVQLHRLPVSSRDTSHKQTVEPNEGVCPGPTGHRSSV